jgi:hypothetical protein
VSIQAELGVVGKIGTELQEKWPEVLIDAVEVVMVHRDRGLYDPGISALRLRIATFLGAIDRAFFLGLADEYHTFPLVELLALLFGKVVFALSLLKGDQGNLVVLGKVLKRADELACDGLYHTGGGHFVPRWMRMNFKVP